MRGHGHVHDAFLARPQADISGLVVWSPQISTDTEAAAVRQKSNDEDSRISWFWDGERVTSDAFRPPLGITGPAWDVYMLYPAGVLWEAQEPPPPEFWMHQLSERVGAPQDQRFSAQGFSDALDERLSRSG